MCISISIPTYVNVPLLTTMLQEKNCAMAYNACFKVYTID